MGRALNIAAIAALAGGVAICHTAMQPLAPPAPPSADFSARFDAEEAVRSVLKDPEAAKFSGEFVRDAKLPVVCGRVNAKNGFGAYNGPVEFVVVGRGAAVREPADDHDAAFVRAWNRTCLDIRPPASRHRHRHRT